MSKVLVATKQVVVGELVDDKKLVHENGSAKKVIHCEIEGSLYKDNLPEGLTMDTVKAVNKYNESYIELVTKDSVDAGIKILKENKDADRVIFKAPYLSDEITSRTSRIDIAVDREKTITIPGKGQEVRPVFGVNVINKFESLGDTFNKELKAKLIENLGK